MRYFIIPAFCLLLFSCSSEKESNQVALEERISRIENGLQPNLQIEGDSLLLFNIEERLRELGIPGVSIAFLANGEIEWARAYGMADSSENRPMTIETMLLAGSISKPVAALRAHQLVESGLINLDTDVNEYLKSWKVPENEFTKEEKVTIRRILNHTAGLTVWGFPGYDKGDTIPSVPEVLDGKGNTDSVRVYKKPGESWMYSGGGYTIMQLIITDLEGSSFPEIMQKNVLGPLGMISSTFENPLPEKYHAIAATGYRGDGTEVEGKWPIYPEMAAAGLWTTPSQLILWAKEIQQIYQSKKDGFLKSNTINEMLTAGMNDHGLGPGVSEFSFGHSGADEGFRANMIAWKDSPYAVVIMVNSDNGSIMQEILLSIAAEYDLPGISPNRRKVQAMTEEERQIYAGIYRIPELGEVVISVSKNGLEINAEFSEEPEYILPENDSTFFSTDDGGLFNFRIEAGKVKSLRVQNFVGIKLD
jgi:CubicO group peptidase (beta-lactamase class C family)